MEKLPQEIVDRIVFFYYKSPDDRYLLTVSKKFQLATERRNLRSFNLTEDNAQKFLQLYTSYRIRYLRTVLFKPLLPKLQTEDHQVGKCRETPEDLLEKDESYTRQIEFLFKTLKSLEDQWGSVVTGRLRLKIVTPRRFYEWSCLHRFRVCWRVHMLRPETLPRLSSVQTLCIKDGGWDSDCYQYRHPIFGKKYSRSKLDLCVTLHLASKLPKLERLHCMISRTYQGANSTDEHTRHYSKDWAGPLRDSRHEFAETFNYVNLPASLRNVELSFHEYCDEDQDQREKLPNLILPCQYDPFSTSLRILSYKLHTLVLRVTADQTLFWPGDGTTPYWPSLKYLDVVFMPASSSGAWYFQGPQGEGSDPSEGKEITQADYEPMEENATDDQYHEISYLRIWDHIKAQFRIVPLEETLRPFLVSFARAAANMPSLRKAILYSWQEFNPKSVYKYYGDMIEEMSSFRLGWGIGYSKPGDYLLINEIGYKDSTSRQFWWMTHDWRPDEELHSLFHEVGRLEHGDEVVDHWGSDHGSKWCDRRDLMYAVFPRKRGRRELHYT